MLTLTTFGGLSVTSDSGPLTGAATQRRRLAILPLLAVAGARGLSRDKLLAYLWPEADPEKARHGLTQALYALRRDLHADGLFVGQSDIRLNVDLIQSDIGKFLEALDENDDEVAVALYAGPFLDGFHLSDAPDFERWVDAERQRLRALAASAVERLARTAADSGDLAGAISMWRRLSAIDPLNGRVAVELMQAMARAGDRAGALQHARVHAALLRAELDVEPDDAVVALAARLRQAAESESSRPPAAPSVESPAAIASGDTSSPSAGRRSTGRMRARRPAIIAAVAAATIAIAAIGLRVGAPEARTTAPIIAVDAIRDYAGWDTTELARPLSDMLATNLSRIATLQVVSTARLYEISGQLGVRGESRIPHKVARLAGATELLEGALHRRPGQPLLLELRRVDLASGAIKGAYSVEATDLSALVDSATAHVAAAMNAPTESLRVADVTTSSMLAYRFYEEGLRALFEGDARTAHRLMRASLSEDSAFAMAAYYAGMTGLQLGEEGTELLRQAVRRSGRTTERERLLIHGGWAQWINDPAALAIAETLSARFPMEPDGHFRLGQALVMRGEFAAAQTYLRRVVAMDSLSLRRRASRCIACDALNQIVYAYRLADSLPASERAARHWVELQPTSPHAWQALAMALEYSGRATEALAARRAARRFGLTSEESMLGHASLLLREGSFREAEVLLNGMVQTGTPSMQSEARWLLAISRRYQGRFREARAAARALRAPGDTGRSIARHEPYLAEAQVLFEAGRPRAAAALMDTLLALPLVPTMPAAMARRLVWHLTHKAASLAAAGDTPSLGAIADSIERLGMRSAYGRDAKLHHHVRGLLMIARGRLPEAEVHLLQAMYSPTSGYTRTNLELARVRIALGRPDDAIDVLRPALRGPLDASNLYLSRTDIHELLAQAHAAAGRSDSATVHYRWVVDAWRNADAEVRPRLAEARAWLRSVRHASRFEIGGSKVIAADPGKRP